VGVGEITEEFWLPRETASVLMIVSKNVKDRRTDLYVKCVSKHKAT